MNVIQMSHKHNPLNAHELPTQFTQDTWTIYTIHLIQKKTSSQRAKYAWATYTTHSIPMNHPYNALNIHEPTTQPNQYTWTDYSIHRLTSTTHPIHMNFTHDALSKYERDTQSTQYAWTIYTTNSINMNQQHKQTNTHAKSSQPTQ